MLVASTCRVPRIRAPAAPAEYEAQRGQPFSNACEGDGTQDFRRLGRHASCIVLPAHLLVEVTRRPRASYRRVQVRGGTVANGWPNLISRFGRVSALQATHPSLSLTGIRRHGSTFYISERRILLNSESMLASKQAFHLEH